MSDLEIVQQLNSMLADANEFSAFFYHGATSAICLQPVNIEEKSALVNKISGALDGNCKQLLRELATSLQTALDSAEFEYSVPIGEANDDLLSDIECLADWCRGFLVGWSVGSIKLDTLEEDHQGVMQDMLAISEVSADGDEEASDLIEVVEYIRVAVLSMYEQLNPIIRTPIAVDDDEETPTLQ